MSQLLFNFDTIQTENKILDPQPPLFSDCISDYKNPGYYGFWYSNPNDGHECVQTVYTKDLTLSPMIDTMTKKWIWKKTK